MTHERSTGIISDSSRVTFFWNFASTFPFFFCSKLNANMQSQTFVHLTRRRDYRQRNLVLVKQNRLENKFTDFPCCRVQLFAFTNLDVVYATRIVELKRSREVNTFVQHSSRAFGLILTIRSFLKKTQELMAHGGMYL